MIGYVKGILEEADDQCIIVDNHGIGYRIFVPGSVFSGVIPIGQEVNIYISECKRRCHAVIRLCDKRRSESV